MYVLKKYFFKRSMKSPHQISAVGCSVHVDQWFGSLWCTVFVINSCYCLPMCGLFVCFKHIHDLWEVISGFDPMIKTNTLNSVRQIFVSCLYLQLFHVCEDDALSLVKIDSLLYFRESSRDLHIRLMPQRSLVWSREETQIPLKLCQICKSLPNHTSGATCCAPVNKRAAEIIIAPLTCSTEIWKRHFSDAKSQTILHSALYFLARYKAQPFF